MVVCIGCASFGIFRLWAYTYPMLNQDYRSAVEASVGDEVLAWYARGVERYRLGDHRNAKRILTEAFNKLTRETGLVPEDRRQLGSDIQHLLGVVNEHEKQFRLAVSAYEESLKLEPNNLASKYNLERLKNQYPDLGKSKSDPKDPGNGNRGDKKGI